MSIDPRVDIGHVHLKVADIGRALEFWHGVLGFDVTQRLGDQAAFLSAGGYHHHVGINTWAGVGAPPPPADSVGLEYFTILLPSEVDLDTEKRQAMDAGLVWEEKDSGLLLHDPSGNGVLLTMEEALVRRR